MIALIVSRWKLFAFPKVSLRIIKGFLANRMFYLESYFVLERSFSIENSSTLLVPL